MFVTRDSAKEQHLLELDYYVKSLSNSNIKFSQTNSKQNIKNLDDWEVLDLILVAKRPEVFEEIYDRYADKIFRKCLSFTKDESEAKDLAHDVIVKIYLNLPMYNKKSKFSTWIYAITFNHCVDYQTKKKKQQSLSEELKQEEQYAQNVQNESSPSDAEIMAINIETLKLLLEELSVAEKSILLMKYQDDLSIKYMAELLEAGESAVKMKLKRAKAKLIKLYEGRK